VEIAKALGISQSLVSKIEATKQLPDVDIFITARELAAARAPQVVPLFDEIYHGRGAA
jgi:transcriptional regulator with XRE-family HTH domain